MIDLQPTEKLLFQKPKNLSFKNIPPQTEHEVNFFNFSSPSPFCNFLSSLSIHKKKAFFDFSTANEDLICYESNETPKQKKPVKSIFEQYSTKTTQPTKPISLKLPIIEVDKQLQIKKLKKSCKLIADVINRKDIKVDRNNLGEIELNLIKAILARKFNVVEVVETLRSITSCSETNLFFKTGLTINSLPFDKRKDEAIKFFFKHTIKHLKKKMGVPYKSTDATEELKFWKHYFQKTSEEMNIPLEEFFDPLNNRKMKNPSFKNLKNGYLKLVFRNEEFKRDFWSYLENELKDAYQLKVFGKLKKMVKPIRSKLKGNRKAEYGDCVQRYIEKIQKSKNFKFPWTDKEIDEGINIFKEHVESILNKKDVTKTL